MIVFVGVSNDLREGTLSSHAQPLSTFTSYFVKKMEDSVRSLHHLYITQFPTSNLPDITLPDFNLLSRLVVQLAVHLKKRTRKYMKMLLLVHLKKRSHISNIVTTRKYQTMEPLEEESDIVHHQDNCRFGVLVNFLNMILSVMVKLVEQHPLFLCGILGEICQDATQKSK